jgi:hypothetical protein
MGLGNEAVKEHINALSGEKRADKLRLEIELLNDYPITVEEATEMGLPITVGLPHCIYNLMDLYPQPQGGRPSVQYIPMPDDDRRLILPTPKGKPLEQL